VRNYDGFVTSSTPVLLNLSQLRSVEPAIGGKTCKLVEVTGDKYEIDCDLLSMEEKLTHPLIP
jgi:hypothetical protein